MSHSSASSRVAAPGPFASRLRKPVTLRVCEDVLGYFKRMSEETGVPYQSLINMYLRDCVTSGRHLSVRWDD